MPIGYFITVAILALGTAVALAPPRRPPALRRAALVPGMILNEVPLPALLVLAASTALAFAEGNIDSAPAWVAVGVAITTALGLAALARRATLARPKLEHALKEGLGPAANGAAVLSAPGPLELLGAGLVPWLIPKGGVKRVADLSYGDAGEENKLDVYSRPWGHAAAPMFVYFHGGGYRRGAKNREARALMYRLAREGWICVSANYRLRPRADLVEHEPSLQPGFELVDTSVSGAICLYAYLGNYYGMGAESSPLGHIRADAPPFFLAQGELDTYSPRFVAIARGFAEELDEVSGSPVVYAELPGAQHAFDLVGSVRFEAVIDAVLAFTGAVREGRQGGGRVHAA